MFRYLSLLLSNEKSLLERKQQLEEEYRISMNDELKEEMSSVCNMGEAIRRKSRAEGRAEGETRLSMLMAKLFSQNRLEDAKKCTDDPEYREKLYREFQLV